MIRQVTPPKGAPPVRNKALREMNGQCAPYSMALILGGGV